MSLSDEDTASFIKFVKEIEALSIFYSFMIVANMGIILNILNIRTYSRRSFASKTIGFYNILMSTFHILSIVTGYLFFFPASIGKPDLTLVSDFACASIWFAAGICTQMSSWMHVLVSFDRSVYSLYPQCRFFKIFKSKRKLLWIVAGIFAVISICNIPNLFFNVKQRKSSAVYNLNATTRMCTTSVTIVFVRDLTGLIMRTMLPVCLEFVLNAILICTLIKYKKNMANLREERSEYKFTFIIVFVNVLFLLTQSPSFIALIYLNMLGYSDANVNTSRTLIVAQLIYVLTIFFASLDYVCLFFVNFIISSKFRKEFSRK